jgi:hypothetical protein
MFEKTRMALAESRQNKKEGSDFLNRIRYYADNGMHDEARRLMMMEADRLRARGQAQLDNAVLKSKISKSFITRWLYRKAADEIATTMRKI